MKIFKGDILGMETFFRLKEIAFYGLKENVLNFQGSR